MSGYNQYPSQYDSPAPGAGYGYPQQDYSQQASPYPPQQGGYGPPAQQYGQPGYDNQQWNQQNYQQQQQQQQGYGGYGPPAHGGFQSGQAPPEHQYGQGVGYTGQYSQDPNRGYEQQGPSQQFPQQGAYNSQPYPSDPNAPQGYQQQHYQGGNTDPAAAGEGERGLMGAITGGAGGVFAGKKLGDHPIIGGIIGAIAGSKAEDKLKENRHNSHSNQGYGGHGKW